MAETSFLYIAFFLTVGSFILGFIMSWNLKHVFDIWVDRADYAKVVMHPEMYENGELTNEPLIYLHIDDEDDMMYDEDD